ncbi:zinc-binding domain-containing protein [Apiospora marii]|uniref:zinc-binding domain-containing protein n=1 Tax=Apiospora marii TaxID=335849 RepID=UPI003131E086
MANGKHVPFDSAIETRTSFMFPWLHKRVVDAIHGQIDQVTFHKEGQDSEAQEKYETFIMGKFTCTNNLCSKSAWSSKKVNIIIRRFTDGEQKLAYNATVFNQRCKSCNALGTFSIDQRCYVNRVAYRIRSWAGVKQERAPYNFTETSRPHEEDLCEGCKRGHCQRGDSQRSRTVVVRGGEVFFINCV